MLNRIKEILAVEYPKVKTKWSNKEIRWVNFTKLISNVESTSTLGQLHNKEIFAQVKTDGRTLLWDGLASIKDYDGKVIATSLDFCPDVLYENSEIAVH